MNRTILLFTMSVLLASCYKDDINDLNDKYDKIKTEQERQAEQLRNYETVLNAMQSRLTVTSVDNVSGGYTIKFSDGSKIDMTNGHTPVFTIGENGNWFVNGVDTNAKAKGENGTNGASPVIEIINGYWYINGTSTGVRAEPLPPANGTATPTITDIVVQNGSMVFSFSDLTQITVPMGQNTAVNFTDGFFIVNEGWFGHDQGSVNFYRNSSANVETGLFATANPGKELGVTTQYGAIFNDRMYLVSKQGALVAVDSKTMVETGRIDNFNAAAKDGRAFCGVTADLGLVSTADGVYKLNLNPLSLGDKVAGISGHVGELLYYRQNVYAVAVNKIYVINTTTWAIDKTFAAGKGGLVVSKDGMIWSSNASKLYKINPYNQEIDSVVMPTGTSVTYNAFAWTASSLCASKTENALYFRNSSKVYKYVIGDLASLSTPLFTVPAGQMVYGSGINVNPTNNQIVVTTIGGYGTAAAKNFIYFYDGTTGLLKRELAFEYYWFPAQIVFPEN